jgi:hypothetical protein
MTVGVGTIVAYIKTSGAYFRYISFSETQRA